jgi:hypothetical protein
MSALKTQVTVESADDLTIAGLAVPFGDRDLDGETFDQDTDFCLSWFADGGRPILYHHGLDGAIKTEVVGRQVEADVREEGIWIKAQLDRRSRWLTRVMALLRRGSLGWSSGAMAHLVEATKTGRITRWPIVEFSLTPTPASPRTAVFAYAVKSALAMEHLAAVGTRPPRALAGLGTPSDADLLALEAELLVSSLRRSGHLGDARVDTAGLEAELLVAQLRRAGIV